MEHLLELVRTSVSSIFTKQDILTLIELEIRKEKNEAEQMSPVLKSDDYDRLKQRFEEAMDMSNNREEVVELDSADFSIHEDNKIVLDSVNIDMDVILGNLDAALEHVFNILAPEEPFEEKDDSETDSSIAPWKNLFPSKE